MFNRITAIIADCACPLCYKEKGQTIFLGELLNFQNKMSCIKRLLIHHNFLATSHNLYHLKYKKSKSRTRASGKRT